jgi:hypothetical protein
VCGVTSPVFMKSFPAMRGGGVLGYPGYEYYATPSHDEDPVLHGEHGPCPLYRPIDYLCLGKFPVFTVKAYSAP